jgi:hypothetical protein
MSWWKRNKPVTVSSGTTTLNGKTVDVTIPSGETIDLEGVETWQVTWLTRHGQGIGPDYTRTRPKGQLFTNKKDAVAFANALRDAYDLVGNIVDGDYVEYERVM